MRNIFLKKSYTKCDGETIPRNFSRESELGIGVWISGSMIYGFMQFWGRPWLCGGGHPCRGVICGMWGCGLCPRSKARCERFSPSEVYPAGKVQ